MEKSTKRTRYYTEGSFRLRMKEEGGGYVLVPTNCRFFRVQGNEDAPEAEEGRDNILFTIDRYAHFFDKEGRELCPEVLGSGTIDGQVCVEYQSYDYKVGKSSRHWEGYKAVAFLVKAFERYAMGWSAYIGGAHD